MKSLIEYINYKAISESKSDSTSVTFNFDGIDNSEELLKSLTDMEYVTVDGSKVTVTISSDNCNKLDTVQDILQQAIQMERSGQRSSSSEQYAQKVASLEKALGKMNDAIDNFCNPEEE